MATEWSWNFFDAEVADEGDLKDVLKAINYTLRGTRGDAEFAIGGRCSLGAPDPKNFTSFSDLTKEKMIELVSTAVNVEALKKQIDEWHDVKKKELPFA